MVVEAQKPISFIAIEMANYKKKSTYDRALNNQISKKFYITIHLLKDP